MEKQPTQTENQNGPLESQTTKPEEQPDTDTKAVSGSRMFLLDIYEAPLATAVRHYTSSFFAIQPPKVIAFLKANALYSTRMIQWMIGFSDRSLGSLLPSHRNPEGRTARKVLRKAGIYRSNGREHFRGFVTLALYDFLGNITGIYGHRVDRHNKGPKEQIIGKGVFNPKVSDKHKEIIIANTILDAWVLYASGFTNVIAEHEHPLKEGLFSSKLGIKRVLLAGDGIDASRLDELQKVQEQPVVRVSFPNGVSVHQFALDTLAQGGSVHQTIKDRIQDAIQGKAEGDVDAETQPEVIPETQPEVIPETKPEVAYETQPEPVVANTPLANNAQPVQEEKAQTESKQTSVAKTKTIVNDDIDIGENEVTFTRDDRKYRVRGLERNQSRCQLKVNILATRDDLVHLDTLDLVKARARTAFIKATASELFIEEEIIKKDIGWMLLQLETLHNEQIEAAKKPHSQPVVLTPDETGEAKGMLRSQNLPQRIVNDLHLAGMIGEPTNGLGGYLSGLSRKLDEPLAVMIQSSTAAGKTSLMDAILSMMPPEDQIKFSGMTGQSLFYLESEAIKHKTLAISEEEGISQAVYALKLLQSEGELRHATVGKEADGRMGMQQYHVQGPVQLFLTTTNTEIHEELINRCLVLTVNETRQQTEAIHDRQRFAKTQAGKQALRAAKRIRRLHQNAQRLLRSLEVYNPYAPQLTFLKDKTRLRRDHAKYLTLINTIALLHQYQRTVYVDSSETEPIEFINVEPSDIAIANGIAGEILGRSLDELSPQTRSFLMRLHEHATLHSKQVGVPIGTLRFTRRDIRESLGWSDFQVRTHLKKLVDLEYVIVHRGKQGRRFVYELLYDGQGREGQPFLMGLLDPSKLQPPVPMTTTSSIGGPTSSILNLPSSIERQS